MNARSTWLGKQRRPIGEGAKKREQAEAKQAREFEKLLMWHRCDFWHCTVAQASQPGYPDYTIFGDGWHAWVELKARAEGSRRAGVVSVTQRRYKASIEASGGEWRSFLWPDQMKETNDWLNAKTGRGVVFT